MNKLLVNKSNALADEIEHYLDCMSSSSLIFSEGIKDYFTDENELMETRCKEISRIEKDADNYLKNIRHKLYSFRIVPDSRADILELLDNMDDLVDNAKQTLIQLYIERPEALNLCKDGIMEMAESSQRAVDELVRGVRVFFSNPRNMDSHVNKVYFYEKEVDQIEERIKRHIFSLPEIGLASKVQVRYFVDKIALLSDRAEEIAKNLLIYRIKRTI